MSASFWAAFGAAPDAVGRAPGRVNLLGEHTDYNDGFVMPVALREHTTVSIGRKSGPGFNLHSAERDENAHFALDRLPDALFARYVFGCLVEAGIDVSTALNIHVTSSVPIGVGLSSSAALEVATLRAIDTLLGRQTDPVLIAQMAQRAESKYAGVQCGIMDQVAASLGDPNHALFLDTRTLETALVLPPPQSAVLVLDSGVPRSLASTDFNQRRRECAEACAFLGVASLRDVGDVQQIESLPDPWRRRARHVLSENARVLCALGGTTATRLGELMTASHASLRDDFEVSVPRLDQLVTLLQAHPAVYGARLTGAGFGGACIALCACDRLDEVSADVLSKYLAAGGAGRELARCLQPDEVGRTVKESSLGTRDA